MLKNIFFFILSIYFYYHYLFCIYC